MRLTRPFKRSVDVPDDVRRRVVPGERVLAGTVTTDGTWLVGTREAMYVVPAGEVRRIPWETVERADWDRDEERLVVTEVGEFGHPRPVHRFGVSDPGLLLELVRERVTASVVLDRRVRVEGKRGLRVIGRRSPVGGGEVHWVYEFDPGVDPADPRVAAAAEEGLRAAQDELGL